MRRPTAGRIRRWVYVLAAATAVGGTAGAVRLATSGADGPTFAASFAGPDRLVANEFGHRHPTATGARTSPDWEVTSGSLFARAGHGWTGVPDAESPDAASANGTGSSVFRMTTRRRDFADVTVSLRLRTNALLDRGRQAPAETDGVHLFLRHKSPAELYVVSLNRRDDHLVVKKKRPGGPVNGGSYTTLSDVAYPVPFAVWQSFTVRVVDVPAGVAIDVRLGDSLLLAVTDRGAGGPPIRGAGAVGLRGDNCDFEFDAVRIVATDPG